MTRAPSRLDRVVDFIDALFDGGASRRVRRRREALIGEGSTDAVRKNDQWGWVPGVLRAEQGLLEFRSESGTIATLTVRTAAIEGPGPSLIGPTVLIRAITTEGKSDAFAVPREAAATLIDLIGTSDPVDG